MAFLVDLLVGPARVLVIIVLVSILARRLAGEDGQKASGQEAS